MSCGKPHATDCAEVLHRVYLYLDREQLTVEHREEVRLHLDECGPCLQQYGLEREVQALVRRCCGGDLAPEALRQSVLVRIRQELSG